MACTAVIQPDPSMGCGLARPILAMNQVHITHATVRAAPLLAVQIANGGWLFITRQVAHTSMNRL
jgi:hypothetical protein